MSTSATSFETISALRDSLSGLGRLGPEYAAKMFHQVPDLPTVKNRAAYLVEKAKDKVVLDIGCLGPISAGIRAVAKGYHGVDRVPGDGWAVVNLDEDPQEMPAHADVELIIASELLEHLANPGRFLAALRPKYPAVPAYFTVPHAGGYSVRNDCEVVNRDHVCWYSYTTLQTLLGRYGYVIQEARWYGGPPHKAEGIIMVVR